MLERTFGRTGWRVGEIGYGMWGLAGWTGSDDSESFEALTQAVALGCTFFDTAWGYGAGHSERILGRLIRSFPDRALIAATKLPPKNFIWPSRREFTLDDCFPPEHIKEYAAQEPGKPRAAGHRPASVPRLGGRLGARRALATRARRSQARRSHSRGRSQR